MKETIQIEGMSCEHCKMAVEKELSHVPGMVHVDVDLKSGTAQIEGEYTMNAVREAVEDAGFVLK